MDKSPRRSHQADDKAKVPVLRALSPQFDQDQHGAYVQMLLTALQLEGHVAPRNVALTGHYGSGKSSVLAQLEKRLEGDAINLSLSSLGTDEARVGRVGADGAPPPLTNLIQKEIVKQLLYRRTPSQMRGSRYRRITAFQWFPAIGWGAIVALITYVLGVLSNMLPQIRAVIPGQFVRENQWVAWTILCILALIAGMLWLLIQRTFYNRLRIERLSAGPATIALANEDNSYFDEYLDEIVYYFQQSKVRVAIFEDLDRFKDPHIFETLRELNTVLNNSGQIKQRPISFVYAIRDSIFEHLNVHAGTEIDDTVDEEGAVNDQRTEPDTHAAMTNRTKFFDLVIPLVPFISHRTSRDLMRRQFEGVERAPSHSLIDLVAAHLTDMRLIKNICNEHEVFANRILRTDGLKGLDADRLFAMVVYKNVHMKDFEAIREGRSHVDKIYLTARELVAQQIERASAHRNAARAALARLDQIVPRSQEAGERLRAVVAALPGNWGGNRTQFIIGDDSFSWKATSNTDFWTAALGPGSQIRMRNQSNQELPVTIPQLETLMDIRLAIEEWQDEHREELYGQETKSAELEMFLSTATVDHLIERNDLTVNMGDGPKTLLEIARPLLSPVALDLLRHGYIDENYTLYVADFHAVSVSLKAMNFILHCVQADQPDIHYKFDGPHDIEAVESEKGARFLHNKSAYNIQVFDYYLVSAPHKLQTAIRSLAADGDEERRFIDAYVRSGSHRGNLMRKLSGRWPDAFRYVCEVEGSPSRDLLNEAIAGGSPDLHYDVDTAERNVIESAYRDLDVFTVGATQKDSRRLAELMRNIGVSIADLGPVAEPQRRELVRLHLYPVTEFNLRAALGDEVPLTLEATREANSAVYVHVLNHLAEYLKAVDVASTVTIEAPDSFASVLSDVVAADSSAVGLVAARSASECIVEDLDEIDTQAWPGLAEAGRFRTSVPNVLRYIQEQGFDGALVSLLENHPEICRGTSTDEDAMNLAVKLLNEPSLTPASRARQIDALMLASRVAASELTDGAAPVFPELLEKGLLEDDAATFARLTSANRSVKTRYIAVSDNFPDYVDHVDLSAEDIQDITMCNEIHESVRRAVFERVADLDNLDNRVATALACWAAKNGAKPSTGVLAKLAASGAEADPIMAVLKRSVNELPLDEIDQVLESLPAPYGRLARADGTDFKLPLSNAVRTVVKRLDKLARVSNSRADNRRGFLKVWMNTG